MRVLAPSGATTSTVPPGLATLAKRDKPDPWRVAEELVARGEREAALAFAKAAPRKLTARLPAYLERVHDAAAAARATPLPRIQTATKPAQAAAATAATTTAAAAATTTTRLTYRWLFDDANA